MVESAYVRRAGRSSSFRRRIKIYLAVLISLILAALIVPAILVARDAARRAQSFG
jgi:hypothetical protein